MSLEDIEKTRAPLMYHLEEFRSRLWKACVALLAGFCVCYYFSGFIYGFLVQPLADSNPQTHHLIYTGLTEAFTTYVNLSLFAGFLLAFPYIAYQFYMFLAPGMYKTEQDVLRPYLILSPILFFLGAALAYYYVMPLAWKFFVSFESPHDTKGLPIQLEARVSEYLSLVMHLIIAFGLVFQLPVALTLLTRVGLMSSKKLAGNRKYAVLVIVIVSALLTPPDMWSQIALSVPLYLLYEISILLCRRIEKRKMERI